MQNLQQACQLHSPANTHAQCGFVPVAIIVAQLECAGYMGLIGSRIEIWAHIRFADVIAWL